MLELAFKTKELRSVCEDAGYAEEVYGPVIARALVGRLADLRAVGHPLELPFAEVRAAADGEPEHVVIGLAAGRSLVIAANHTDPRPMPSGGIAWERVSRIIVLRLE